jgi:hypothetical protein
MQVVHKQQLLTFDLADMSPVRALDWNRDRRIQQYYHSGWNFHRSYFKYFCPLKKDGVIVSYWLRQAPLGENSILMHLPYLYFQLKFYSAS